MKSLKTYLYLFAFSLLGFSLSAEPSLASDTDIGTPKTQELDELLKTNKHYNFYFEDGVLKGPEGEIINTKEFKKYTKENKLIRSHYFVLWIKADGGVDSRVLDVSSDIQKAGIRKMVIRKLKSEPAD